MIPQGSIKATVREAYVNSEDVPTLTLQGDHADLGTVTLLLQGKGLDLTGVTIGSEVEITLTLPPVPALAAGLRYVLVEDEEPAGADLPSAG